MPEPASKICVVCGRTMQWRKKWERNWDEVRHCSDACRRRGSRPVDLQLENAIMGMLEDRRRNATICSSDAARLVGGDDWESLAEPARAAARRLCAEGRVVITQGGRQVDPSTAKGTFQIGRS